MWGVLPVNKMGTKLILVVLLQIGLMFSVAIPVAHTLLTGKSVILKTVPVDPYDMFRGDYISLRYDISTIRTNKKFEHDQVVYVALRQDGNIWVVRDVAASTKELDLRPGEVLLTGRVDYASERDVHVRYGIEQVFIKERTGSEIENKGNILVVARVDNEGKAVISHVEGGNKVIYDAREMILGGK